MCFEQAEIHFLAEVECYKDHVSYLECCWLLKVVGWGWEFSFIQLMLEMTDVGHVFLWFFDMYFSDPQVCISLILSLYYYEWSCFISNAVGWRWLVEDGNIHTANVGNDPRGTLSLADTHGPRGALLLLCQRHNRMSYLIPFLVILCHFVPYIVILAHLILPGKIISCQIGTNLQSLYCHHIYQSDQVGTSRIQEPTQMGQVMMSDAIHKTLSKR